MVTDPPYFVVRPKLFYQRDPGQSVTFPCSVRGQPAPSITWRKV